MKELLESSFWRTERELCPEGIVDDGGRAGILVVGRCGYGIRFIIWLEIAWQEILRAKRYSS